VTKEKGTKGEKDKKSGNGQPTAEKGDSFPVWSTLVLCAEKK